MNFLKSIKQRAKEAGKTIVLPETGDMRTLNAADMILREDIAKIILIGSKDEILAKADGLDLSKAMFIDPENYAEMDSLADKLADLRKDKGMTKEDAAALLKDDTLYLGCMLVKEGIADGMVAGAVNSTPNVLRPCLQILKTAPGVKLVSSFFVMVVPDCDFGEDGVFIFSDSGLVQNPNSEELAAIAQSAAESFRKLVQAEPKVAFLSHSTKGSAKHPDVNKVTEAVRIAKEEAPDILMDGELQLDAAIVPEIGKQKAPNSPVAGNANVLVFPDLDAGNIGYKLVERLAKAEAYGPITQGIAKPVNDLSRGCTAEDIVGVAAITAVQAITE
ncbi:Phosphate acetyltransferase [Methanimicrococcus sp. At1]|uniref:Phosphate acetyltransferase n=1 Tax=Methanimicrococcus hacksteinii TaxID=3028293 RepID=A0ABU3VPL4_9EURY|nr:phosphate acetyltransferase [Methanimicrococcus sp. At1]MDV0445352.1 Phosphate acetyltransferase [Methanimicrococcus sp. At1]